MPLNIQAFFIIAKVFPKKTMLFFFQLLLFTSFGNFVEPSETGAPAIFPGPL